MNITELKEQEFYKKHQQQIDSMVNELLKLGVDYNKVIYQNYVAKLKTGNITNKEHDIISHYISIINTKKLLCADVIDFLKNNKFDDLHDYEIALVDAQKNLGYYLAVYDALKTNFDEYTEAIRKAAEQLEKELSDDKEIDLGDILGTNKYNDTTFGTDFEFTDFDELIEENEDTELEKWYKFLKSIHENPRKEFTINKNVICNYRLIFRNPFTGLYTDKEVINHLSHSTSSKKMPVFGVGSQGYQAVSTGVKLLAGSIVTAALENIPLPHLHAISYMNHISVEDLPPLDLYIIPIEAINDDGRYDVLLIKGIQFVDSKQNDNASSTGVYYSFSYFAKDITTIDFYEARKYVKLISENQVE